MNSRASTYFIMIWTNICVENHAEKSIKLISNLLSLLTFLMVFYLFFFNFFSFSLSIKFFGRLHLCKFCIAFATSLTQKFYFLFNSAATDSRERVSSIIRTVLN